MSLGKSSFRCFFAFLDKDQSKWDAVKLPDQFVSTFGKDIPFNVELRLQSGRIIGVHYIKNSQEFRNLGKVFKECMKTGDTTLVFCYKEIGKFKLVIFDKHGSEVQYSIPKKQESEPVGKQDTTLGAGWSFISVVNKSLIYDGQVDIPRPFSKRFKNVIPPYVLYALHHGQMYKGRYSSEDRKLYDLVMLAIHTNIKEEDVLMFTLWEHGEFAITLFNKLGVEMIIDETVVKTEPFDEIDDKTIINAALYNEGPDHQH